MSKNASSIPACSRTSTWSLRISITRSEYTSYFPWSMRMKDGLDPVQTTLREGDGHPGLDPVFSRLVVRGAHHAALLCPSGEDADQDRRVFQGRCFDLLDLSVEVIEVEVTDYAAQNEDVVLPLTLFYSDLIAFWWLRRETTAQWCTTWWGRPDLNRGSQAPEASSSMI